MDPERKAWSIVTKSRGGTVSVLRDLTIDECRQTYERLNPEYGRTVSMYARSEGSGDYSGGGWMSYSCNGDIVLREVFGPEDWDRKEMESWPHWPKYEEIKWDDPHHERHWRADLKKAADAFAEEVRSEVKPIVPPCPRPPERSWVDVFGVVGFAAAVAIIVAGIMSLKH